MCRGPDDILVDCRVLHSQFADDIVGSRTERRGV